MSELPTGLKDNLTKHQLNNMPSDVLMLYLIAHQRTPIGSGIVKQISEKYPEYFEFKKEEE